MTTRATCEDLELIGYVVGTAKIVVTDLAYIDEWGRGRVSDVRDCDAEARRQVLEEFAVEVAPPRGDSLYRAYVSRDCDGQITSLFVDFTDGRMREVTSLVIVETERE